jgi:hypothetical protein
MSKRIAAAVAVMLTLSGCIDSGPNYKDCTAAREAGAAPINKGEPGYRTGLDRNGDGVACEESK